MVKILLLIVYTPRFVYEQQMRELHRTALAKYQASSPKHTVTMYFVAYRDQAEELVVEDDIIWVRGVESMTPGILDKTICALKYCFQFDFDIMIRSTPATAIDFKNFPVGDIKSAYSSPCCLQIAPGWRDPPAHIVDDRFVGTRYAMGTVAILSRAATKVLIEAEKPDVVDDVAIGLMLAPYVSVQQLPQKLVMAAENSGIFVRHRADLSDTVRTADVEALRRTFERFAY